MLLVDLRQLREGPVVTKAGLAPDDETFSGLDLSLAAPLEVDGRLQQTSDGDYFWHAWLRGLARGECRRCLKEVEFGVDSELRVLFTSDPDAVDDPGVYQLSEQASEINLSEAVREELALAVPSYILCREDCAGLCPGCGADMNAGPCRCTPVTTE